MPRITNVLRPLVCPQCETAEGVYVNSKVMMRTVAVEGGVVLKEVEYLPAAWNYDSLALCGGCGYNGLAEEFDPNARPATPAPGVALFPEEDDDGEGRDAT